ncbi:hypothetical protein [uncultured Cohaesibacter sp.]|uniref:hypothetical protein n=1 Tax=uncultured Cohaesibacter sp. TaxID=1002546 RepID=UPI002AA753BA|nr:hypothetical protein [uncultured Cohaesibacter sp.]
MQQKRASYTISHSVHHLYCYIMIAIYTEIAVLLFVSLFAYRLLLGQPDLPEHPNLTNDLMAATPASQPTPLGNAQAPKMDGNRQKLSELESHISEAYKIADEMNEPILSYTLYMSLQEAQNIKEQIRVTVRK